ncbi:MAG: TolC family protein [Candidatus Marinimicrobia bacterium]|jgi:outer membrane protein TolC|nr:TolC family protein [Candidatus Neomarinimicrobiota bacterium]|tara:strand:- start:1448 stop:2770 length:1323 start_codon:yes stop_codon:yes gene_type:complete
MKALLISIFLLTFVNSQQLSLEDCIQIGLNNKSTLRSASSGKSAAEQSVKTSLSNLLPSIGFSGSLNRTYFPEREIVSMNMENFQMDTSSLNRSQNLSAGVSVTQKVFDGGQTINRVKQAKSLFQSANFNYQSSRLKVIRDIVHGYFNFLKAKELKDVAGQNLSLSEKQLELVKTKFDLGAVKKTDLLKGEVNKGQAQSEFLRSDQALRNARRNFYFAMGVSDAGEQFLDYKKNIQSYKFPNKENLITIMEENNPRLLRQQSQIQSAKLNYMITRGMKLPSVDAGLNYSVMGENSQEWMGNLKEDWNLGVNFSVSIPIYTGNGLSSQIEQRRIEWNQSAEDYTTIKQNLHVQALDHFELLIQYKDILPIQSQVVESAQEDLTLVRERYALGAATILEVLDAQVSLNLAKTTWVNMKYDFWISAASLKELTGELNPNFGKE